MLLLLAHYGHVEAKHIEMCDIPH